MKFNGLESLVHIRKNLPFSFLFAALTKDRSLQAQRFDQKYFTP